MSRKTTIQAKPLWRLTLLYVLLCLAAAAIGWYIYFTAGFEMQNNAGKTIIYKYVMVAAGFGILILLWLCKIRNLCNLPSLLLIGYATIAMFSVLWTISGRLFIQRYSATFTALFFFLYAVLHDCDRKKFVYRTMSICAGISTIYAILSVEAISTGVFKTLSDKLFGKGTIDIGFGGRLFGIFGNPNFESSFYAIGIIYCIGLICGSKNKKARAAWATALACNTYAMLLSLSLGAIMCFCVASVVYLIIAGKERAAILARMLISAVCGAACAFPASSLAVRNASMMLILLFVCAVVNTLAELMLTMRLSVLIGANQRTWFGILISCALCLGIYIFVGPQISAPYTFTGNEYILRTISLAPGKHTLNIEADENADIRIFIFYRTHLQIIVGDSKTMYDTQTLFDEHATVASFVMPEDGATCTIVFLGQEGSTVYSAKIDGKRPVVLSYRIFPEYFATRLDSIKESSSVIQRQIYVKDGLKLFRLSPIIGLGDGAFESAVSMVQDFEYKTNHSHNQYIEVLLENGIIGFLLFVSSLAAMAFALWKSRKKMQEGEFAWLYPALCAEFVMSTLQMFWDVSMSVTVFACMIYTLYGLIVSICAEPLVLKKATEQELTTEKKSKASVKTQSDVGIRIACSILPLLFIVSVGLNIHAQKLIREPVETLDEFMSNLSRAAKMDLYEHNDTKLSYVRAQMENDEEGIYYAQANEYAQQLSKVQSNSIPYILTVYYLNTQQYELAIEEAKRGAKWSASDSDMWNNCADALKQMFIDTGAYSPLLEEGNGNLIWGLEEYREMLLQRDANSLKPISLNESSAVFFDKVGELFDCRNDRDAMAAVLAGATGE